MHSDCALFCCARRFALLFSLGLIASIGCGSGDAPDKMHVAGTAEFNGKPIAYGTVQFVPDASKGNTGPAGSATIIDGKYDTSKQGTPIIGGPHQVIVNGFDGNADPENELPNGKPIFTDFQTANEFDKAEADSLEADPVLFNLKVPAHAASSPASGQRVDEV